VRARHRTPAGGAIDVASVFLSYRREDSRADAGRMYDRLSAHFGADHVFMDVDDIAAGDNFVARLTHTLGQCDVLLLVIGPRWLSVADAQGRPRLAAPEDFVRLEAQSALERGIPLIPILVGGARMPERGELPAPLAGVVLRQALEISDERFHDDVDRLIAAIERRTAGRRRRAWRRPAAWLAACAAAALLAAAVHYARAPRSQAALVLRSAPATLSVSEVRALLAARGFYHAQWNSGARGPVHEYTNVVAGGEPLVVDAATGLAWQQGGSGRPLRHDEALAQVAALGARRHAGFPDWRLPTLEEALSLMESAKREDGYHLDPRFDRGAAPVVWTADADPEGRRWVVYYYDGIAGLEPPEFNAYLRAVRTLDR
jgi:hypothetical protein